MLPARSDVPTHDEVVALGKSHDKDESGTLDFEEYYEICRVLNTHCPPTFTLYSSTCPFYI
jgi:hypothetical protein